MINELKKFCRSNKLIFYISRVVYYPLKVVMLYKPKKLYRDEAIKALKGRDMGKPAIFFFGIPVHKNLGDLAQTYCSFRYFEKYWPDYQLLAMRTYSTYSKKYIKMLQNNIREDDVIFFQSGYCTTDEHLDHTMHKIMVKAFPNNKIVFMPQTVLFNNNKEKTKTSELFDAHKRTLFIARDEMSYNTAKEMFPHVSVECFPDIVTTLIGTYPLNDNRNGILMCLRNDYEQLYSKDDMSRLKRRLNEISSRVEVTDTTCNDIPYSTLCSNLGKIIHDKIDYLSGFKVVITDRYHGTIFSMIANVPVIVLASTDHKVTTGLKWFNGVYDGNYYMAKSIDEAYTLAKEIIKSDIGKKNKPYFEEKYYSNLREMVGKL